MTKSTIQQPKEMNKDARGSYASVNGLTMSYEIHGSGDRWSCCLGECRRLVLFTGILPMLAKSRQIIAVEQQGHGHTADIDRRFSFEQMADDTATLLQQLGIKKADVFGYSDGSMVALEIAIRHPELIRKLAIERAHRLFKYPLPSSISEVIDRREANPES